MSQPRAIYNDAVLPAMRGKIRADADLSIVNWFQVGGKAEWLFKPEDTDDLAYFMAHRPADMAVTVLGVGSNLLVRDGGIDGVVIRLGRSFAECRAQGDRIVVGAGCLNSNMTLFSCEQGIGGARVFKRYSGLHRRRAHHECRGVWQGDERRAGRGGAGG